MDELVARADIVELVGGYVRFVKRSGSNMLALCPFHSEKTPSFTVNAEKQMYYCFGCGKGGGAINFLMEIEHVPFHDAVEMLAKRMGMTVPDSGEDEDTAGKRRRMFELNRDAARYFHETLMSPLGARARSYLVERGISKAMVTRFGIGAAPDSWRSLLEVMIAKGYSRKELIEAGLARQSAAGQARASGGVSGSGGSGVSGGGGGGVSGGSGVSGSGGSSSSGDSGGSSSSGSSGGSGSSGDSTTSISTTSNATSTTATSTTDASKTTTSGNVYDMFRNRLMFPVIDVRGNVIGFSGRILGDGEPKYLNSPDTLAFSKNRNLFALNIAKKTKSGMLILAEGNIDVVTLHQAGFDCAVASLGTALTAEQVKLMSRYTNRVVIAYDSDDAGRKAALRAISLLEKTDMQVNVVGMGNSKDPDEFLRKNGADAFRLLLEGSENHIEYRLMTIKNNADLSTDDGRIAYLSKAIGLLSELPTKPEREIYGARVAEAAGVSIASVTNEVEKIIRINYARQKKDFEKRVAQPSAAIQPSERSLRYKDEYSAVAEEGLIRCFVLEPSLLRRAAEMGFAAEEFTSPFLSKVFQMLQKRMEESGDASVAPILSVLEQHEASQLTSILQKPESMPRGDAVMRDYINKIRLEKLKSVTPDTDMLMELKKFREKKDGVNVGGAG